MRHTGEYFPLRRQALSRAQTAGPTTSPPQPDQRERRAPRRGISRGAAADKIRMCWKSRGGPPGGGIRIRCRLLQIHVSWAETWAVAEANAVREWPTRIPSRIRTSSPDYFATSPSGFGPSTFEQVLISAALKHAAQSAVRDGFTSPVHTSAAPGRFIAASARGPAQLRWGEGLPSRTRHASRLISTPSSAISVGPVRRPLIIMAPRTGQHPSIPPRSAVRPF